MANVRIKDLTTTAATTASDDFFGVDGATNGTRKLNAYSPTFGGNLTVSGTGTHSFNGPVSITGTTASNLLRLTKSGAGSKTFGIDNALDFRIYADNGSTQLFKLTDSGDTTITGNLTVSGGTITGGTSGMSLASGGTNQNITLTPSGTGFASIINASGAARSTPLFVFNGSAVGSGVEITSLASNLATSGEGGSALKLGIGFERTNSYGRGWIHFYNNNTADGSNFTGSRASTGDIACSVAPGGNFLIGTTTDSANGRLQLATHTTSAGGIGFGTDISLFRRNANGGLALNATSGNPGLYFRDNVTDTAFLGTVGGDFYFTVPTAKNIYFSTNDTAALTLFSNQAALLAGNLTVSGGTITSGSGTLTLKSSGNTVVLQSANTTALTLDSSQNATFAGNIKTAAPSGGTAATWRLGTVASVSPTSPNRTIEVEIGGTTYYIHAKTTND